MTKQLFLGIQIKFFLSDSFGEIMYSRLPRCNAARESNIGFSMVGPTEVKACKFFLFTEKFPCIENKEYLLDFVITSKNDRSCLL